MEVMQRSISFLRSLTRPHPARDWLALLVVSGVAALAGFGVAAYYFLGIQSGNIIGEAGGEQAPAHTVSREALGRVLETFSERAVNYDAGNVRTPAVPDPR